MTRTWQWACLSCNETWSSSSSAHSCASPLEYLREFWGRRLRWSTQLRDKPAAQLRALICKPISRELLVGLIGPSWSVAGDDGSRLPSHTREASP